MSRVSRLTSASGIARRRNVTDEHGIVGGLSFRQSAGRLAMTPEIKRQRADTFRREP